MSASTPSPADAGLPAPPTSSTATATATSTSTSQPTSTASTINALPVQTSSQISAPRNPANEPENVPPSSKPVLLHLGDDIRWNHTLYSELGNRFTIERSYSMGREEFKQALQERRWSDFVAMYRPFWNTGGEMGSWDRELISLLPKSCKIYASAGAGFDWVDTKTMAEHGIIYCNASPPCTESVADTAIFLLLSTFRSFPRSFLAARSLSLPLFWDANRNLGAVTHNPRGYVCGIVGLGRIGFRIAQKASRALGMRIAYTDVVRLEDREQRLNEEISVVRRWEKPVEEEGLEICHGWEEDQGDDSSPSSAQRDREREEQGYWDVRFFSSLEELMRISDALVLCTPFSGSPLLTSSTFAHFKPGARLINIARGKLIDEDALNKALDEGTVSAAGLDVHANEPHVDKRLAERENVMVLSHTAGASVESHVGFEALGMRNLISWVEGKGALTPVNRQWLRERE